jgi:PAS domain S-box-containing protein
MTLPLIDRSIRWRLLVYITGFVLILRACMLLIHHYGEQEVINITIAQLKTTTPEQWTAQTTTETLNSIRQFMNMAHRQFFIRETLISLFFFGLIILVVLMIANRLSRPLIELDRTVRQISSGNFSAALSLEPAAPDEIGKLSDAIVTMADNLQSAQQHLEQNVKEIQAAERRLDIFFQQASEMLGIADYDTRIIYCNEAFLNTLGFSKSDIIGASYLDLVHPDDLEASREAVIALGDGKSLTGFENRFRCQDGTYRRITWNVASDPEARYIYAAGRDITEERKLEEEVVRAATAEQERIARDLHDSVGQLLTGLAFKAKLIEEQLRHGQSPRPEQAAELVAIANRTSTEVRALARGIDPVELQRGLSSALEYLASTTSATFNLPCSYEGNIPDNAIDKNVATHLYRIAQEAVNNAIKHSRARQININLEREDNKINLTITDNGCGLVRRPEVAEGHGFRIMQHRARMISGALKISPMPDCGLCVKCSIHIS